MAGGKIYEQWELDFIKDNYAAMGAEAICKKLKRPLSSIYTTACRIKNDKLDRSKNRVPGRTRSFKLTPEMESFIKENYESMGNQELADHFNKHFPRSTAWKHSTFASRLSLWGLKRSQESIDAIYQRAAMNDKAVADYIVKGSDVLIPLTDEQKLLKEQVMQHPGLLNLKRQSIILNRTIKNEEKKLPRKA
jgi:hypothetical protein